MQVVKASTVRDLLTVAHTLAALEAAGVDRRELDCPLEIEGYTLQLSVRLKAMPVAKLRSPTTLDATQIVENLKRIVDAVSTSEGD